MTGQKLNERLTGLNLHEVKQLIFSLIDQYFPVMKDAERQEFIMKLLGQSGNAKLSSMVSR